MAAELVESSETPQTCAHDLESFFWVLLRIVMTQVETNVTERTLSSILHDVMNCNPGSMAKALFLKTADGLAEEEFKIRGNPNLRRLLEELQTTLASAHRERKKRKFMSSTSVTKKYMESGITDSKSDVKDSGDRNPPQLSSEFKELYEKLSLHFSEALAGTGWPGEYKVDPQDIPPPANAYRNNFCGSKRAWDASLTNTISGPVWHSCSGTRI